MDDEVVLEVAVAVVRADGVREYPVRGEPEIHGRFVHDEVMDELRALADFGHEVICTSGHQDDVDNVTRRIGRAVTGEHAHGAPERLVNRGDRPGHNLCPLIAGLTLRAEV